MNFQQAYAFLIEKLEKELPGYLTYHSAAHTREVIQSVQRLAESEGASDEEKELLCTAALFHDAGYLEGNTNHEERSFNLAMKYLPEFGYSREQIRRVCNLIMTTRLPHRPTDKLEEIMCDADLYYLGTEHYSRQADNLYNELKALGLISGKEEWQKQQISFLQGHRYFTQTAREECNPGKQQNLLALRSNGTIEGTKKHRMDVRRILKDGVLIIAGILSAGFALQGFLVPNSFFDGGITGISLLLKKIYHFDLSVTIIIANLPLIVASFYTVNREFALKTIVCVVLLGLCVLYVPYPVVTSDKLLISIFGGFFLGMGSGLIMRAGGALDGVEILALYTLKRTSFTVSEIILGINILIFGVAAFEFGLETALYSILTYFTASRTIEYVVEGIEEYTGVTIISQNSEMIKYRLVKELGRGITVYKGERGYLPSHFEISNECDIIFTVITRLELRKLRNVVNETDKKAFVFASTIKEASGGILRRRQLH